MKPSSAQHTFTGKQRPLRQLRPWLSAGALLIAAPTWAAPNVIVVSATQADGFYVALESHAVRLSAAANVDMVDSGGDGRKRTTRIANQRLEQSYELAVGESAKVEFAPDRRSATITIAAQGSAAPASTPAAVAAPAAKSKAKEDETIKKMIDAGKEDLGVPSAPALTLLNLNAGAASVARTPKDVAASLVNGRGSDGKIQSGIAVDISLVKLLTAFAPAASPNAAPAVSSVASISSPTARRYFESVGERSKYGYVKLDGGLFPSFRGGDATNSNDLSHRAINRIKLSLATTEITGATDKRAVNFAYGVNYVFFDNGDPLTTFCNGKNSSDAVVQQRVKEFIKARGLPPIVGDVPVTSRQLQELRIATFPDLLSGDKTAAEIAQELAPITAACSLTSFERLAASAAVVGAAQGYRLADGSWSSRVGTGRTIWASYLSPGLHVGSYFASDAQAQAVLYAKLTRGASVADPLQTDQFVRRDSNQATLRLRAAGTGAVGWYEYGVSKNTTGGKADTVRRQALGFEWKISEGIWLVGAGGSERSSLTGSKTAPFLTTNIRFGGAPGVPAVIGSTQ